MSEDVTDHFAAVAARYDELCGDRGEPEAIAVTADLLASVAVAAQRAGGRGDVGEPAALELAIGTGRIAVPLRQRGIRVAGIDLSAPMVEQLRAKPGAADIDVVIGDMTTATVPGSFDLAYLIFNSIENVTTQEGQVACFANAAAHLAPGGCFVVEVGVPQLQRYPMGETFAPFEVTPTHLGFDEIDLLDQGLVSHHHHLIDGRWQAWSMPFRYVWPSELDLMARLAGLRRRDRWAGWRREPFTASSVSHVSVWEKPVG